jgi:hypothetical protein
MSELKTTTFPAGHFNVQRITAIAKAGQLTRGAGADERMRIVDLLTKEWDAAYERDGKFMAVDFEVSINNATLKSWAIGITAGWLAADADDQKCRLLRDAAKALKCWSMVQKGLPKVDDADFEADEEVDEEIVIDSEEGE